MANEDKFTWGPGDIKMELPQCSECINNIGPIECKEFGIKPDRYVENEVECPKKVLE